RAAVALGVESRFHAGYPQRLDAAGHLVQFELDLVPPTPQPRADRALGVPLAALPLLIVVGVFLLHRLGAIYPCRQRGRLFETLEEPMPALAESPRTGEETLLEHLGGEVGRRAFDVVPFARGLAQSLAEVLERLLELPLFTTEPQRREGRHEPLGEARRLAP